MVVNCKDVNWEDQGGGIRRRILASEGRLMSVEVSFTKGTVAAVHAHPHEQIGYILSGRFDFEMDGKKYELGVGDSYYAPPRVPHGAVALEEGSRILDIFTPQREDFLT